MSQDNPKNGNGKISLLTTIAAGGDNMVKIATLGLVLLSGVGNWIKTGQAGGATRTEVDKVLTQLTQIEQSQKTHTGAEAKQSEDIATLKANQEWMMRWINRKNLPPDAYEHQ